jgi:(R,R)-butanediol dehydrogenase/meso-butanediol dehydrogenase/diacetyl reductase
MRAAVYYASNVPLAIEQAPEPTPNDDQVLLEVAYCGICGSDLHMKQHGTPPSGTIFGHEFAGTIVGVGKKVEGPWKIGDRVTALPILPCKSCEACGMGLPGICSNNVFIGTRLGASGGYAEYVAARADQLQRLPSGVSFEHGAMTEPLAVAHHTVDFAELPSKASVLVLGAGPIGAGVALFARMYDAQHVVVSDPADARRQRAKDLGATATVNPKEENVTERFVAIAGKKPDVIFECVGTRGVLQQAMECAGVRGKIVVAGVCFGEDVIKPLTALSRELTLKFAQCYTERDFEAVVNAVAQGKVDVKPMHTHTVGFSELPMAFEELGSAPTACKVLINPKLA